MTILFFARRFYPLIGGVEKHVLEVGKRLVKKGFRVIVFTENEKNTNVKDYQSLGLTATIEGIEIIRINVGKEGKLKKIKVWLGLLRYLGVISSADIVHCHDIFFWYLPFRFVFPLKKVYTTFHGYEGNEVPTKKAKLMHKISEKLSYGNICIGKFLEKWYGTRATYISYGAVDTTNIKSNNIDKNLIVFLGRLEKETGIKEYLKAFKKISVKYPKLKLIVLGDGLLNEEARVYVNKNRLNVEFKGFVIKTSYYLDRAFFVFTSRYLGILESMVNKKYVLAVYNNKIKKDYLEMTPFAQYISISGNANELVNEIKKTLSNGNLVNAKINNAYNWVKKQSWENMVNHYLKLWKTS